MRTGKGAVRVMQLLVPAPFGGLERVVTQLAVGLARRGWPSAVVAILAEGDGEPSCLGEMRLGGVDVFPLRVRRRAYRHERLLVGGVLDEWHPHVVNTHGYRADVVHRQGIQQRGVPAVATAHGFTGGGWKNRLFEWLDRRALARFDAVVAVSRPLANFLRQGGVPAARLVLLPNAWAPGDPPLNRQQSRLRLGIPETAVVIGWVGRLSREKGPDLAIEALAKLRHPSVTLAFVGSGEDESALRSQAARLGVGHRVLWHGNTPDAALLMPAFDLFCLSSRSEGTPMVLFEAMAAGIPVIATRVGGVPDVVSAAEAILVPTDDSSALAGALDAVLAAPHDAAGRAQRAVDRLEQEFALGPWLDRYESLYQSLAGVP